MHAKRTRLLSLLGWIAAIPACASAGSGGGRSSPMHAQTNPTNKEVVRSLYEVSLNTGNVDGLHRWFSSDFVGPSGERGPAAFARTVAELRAAFPDVRYTVEDLVAEEDRVAVRWTFTGTHEGPFRAFAPTGKRIVGLGFGVFRLREGKIVAADVQTDRLGFLQQIGAVPPELGAKLQPGARKAD